MTARSTPQYRSSGCSRRRTTPPPATPASAAAEGANVTILDEREEITFLTGGTLRLPRRKGWGLSVFSLTDRCTGVCLRGVKYRLEDAVLTNRVPLGVSNEFAAPEAEISLTHGILMIAQTKK